MFCFRLRLSLKISKTNFPKSSIMSKTMHASVSRTSVSMQKVPEFSIDEMQNIAQKIIQRYSKDNAALNKRNGKGVGIVWFRNDLRVHDNEALFLAWESSEAVLPVYCVDPRLFHGTYHFGFPKTGASRGQFLMECLTDLKRNLQKQGLDLFVQHGKPEEVLPTLAKTYGAHTVYAQKETCSEELNVEKMVTINLEQVELQRNQPSSRVRPKLKLCWGSTMYHIDDLPFDCTSLPDMYTQFRKSIESKSSIRNCIRMPKSLGPPPDVKDWGRIPDIQELGLEEIKVDRGMKFIGGESAALSRVFEYFWKKDLLKIYKDTRNGMVGADYSTKFSPWLASGCLSPRLIYEEVKRYEKERVANNSTYWVLFELIWRDYFRFLSIKVGNSLFLQGGPRNVKANWTQNQILFDAWKDGQTGYPLVDANMKELSATGFMSNRGRQIVCSFLVRDMGIDWRMGAEWFESCLLDYDPCSNYGNWTYGAGVGNDPREDRYFSIPKQAQNYDPEGEYVSYWLPKLRALPKEKRNFPGAMLYIKPVVALRYGNTKKSNTQSSTSSTSRGMSAAGSKSNGRRYNRPQ